MKGIVCYYSGTGNTKLACEYLAKKLAAVEWTLHDITKSSRPDLGKYDIAGFATFTDFWSVPQKFITFMENLPSQPGKLAFGLNTFGMVSLRTLRDLGQLLQIKEFLVIGGFSLHMPENYPPMITGGMGNENAPAAKELKEYERFLANLNQKLEAFKNGQTFKNRLLGANPLLALMPVPGRTHARKDMGEKFADPELCSQCGRCAENCPYAAITLNPYPGFNMEKCFGCWACFNNCPQKAIYTKKFRGRGHYSQLPPQLLKKFKV